MSDEESEYAPSTSHLLVETKGPWSGPGCAGFLRDARDLARTGHRVRLLFIQDGVSAAVAGSLGETASAAAAGCEIWVDRFSLAQRGLDESGLLPEARPVEMPQVAAWVLEPDVRVVWH
ncbi:DsrE family protein [Streptomyces sp. NPDC059496]|uniref:DsrE family protein n=1 Tax=Streptomyces sp. NPDC059496 TaxID=3346851 RepID=UPI0036AB5CA4